LVNTWRRTVRHQDSSGRNPGHLSRSLLRPDRSRSGLILGISNDGVAVGYYGDTAGNEHGITYNVKTGHYSFVDDPSEALSGTLKITEITGITNSEEIVGVYLGASGFYHALVAILIGR
jgi:hypothetical protein